MLNVIFCSVLAIITVVMLAAIICVVKPADIRVLLNDDYDEYEDDVVVEKSHKRKKVRLTEEEVDYLLELLYELQLENVEIVRDDD